MELVGRSGLGGRRVDRFDRVRTLARAALPLDRVARLRYVAATIAATIPAVCVEREFRAEVESVLAAGESLSEFVETSVRASVEPRRFEAEFIALASEQERRPGTRATMSMPTMSSPRCSASSTPRVLV